MFPFLYKQPEKKKKQDNFVQEQLYIEQSSDFPSIPKEQSKEEKPSRGSTIIQLW